nr:hypothetical protein PsAHV6-015 [Psittacid alphaherpesvirus 6]
MVTGKKCGGVDGRRDALNRKEQKGRDGIRTQLLRGRYNQGPKKDKAEIKTPRKALEISLPKILRFIGKYCIVVCSEKRFSFRYLSG